jgi:uncharacterized protein with beta-barrel porin domain
MRRDAALWRGDHRLRLLLASSSVAALLIGGGAPPALAAPCKPGTTQNGGVAAAVNNSSATGNCILVENSANVTGNVTNTGTGVLTTNGGGTPSRTGITINNSTVAGSVSNAGTITAQGDGIVVTNNATVSGGISNAGMITSSSKGVFVSSVSKFGGGISNSGTIASLGSKAILVSAVSSFSGNITNSGMISGNANVTLFVDGVSTFTGNVVNSGTIDASDIGIAVGQVSTFTGNISNGGTISIGGISAITVQVTSTFTGGVTNSGTLIGGAGISLIQVTSFSGGVSNGGAIISGSGAGVQIIHVSNFTGGVSNNGTITTADGVDISDVTKFVGNISNSDAITAKFRGISVDNVTSFTGNIANGGTITAATGIAIGSGVTFAGGGAIVNTGTITGTNAAIDVSNATTAVIIDQTGGLISGTIKLSPNADVLNISGGIINGNIVGQGTLDTINFALGSGTFTYNDNFTGISQVNVNSGTVILNGVDSATTLAVNGGTLAGTGTIATAMTIGSGATFAPGTPGAPGTAMTITGSLVFQSAATYMVQMNSTSATSANVVGTATLNGNVAVTVSGKGALQHQYTILETSNGTSGTFNSLTTNGLPSGVTASLAYNGDDVFLDLTGALAQLTGTNANQQNVANTINNFFNNGGTLPPGFVSLFNLSGANLGAALSQLDGEDATGAEHSAFQLMNDFLSLMLDPYVDGRTGGGAGGPLGFAPDQPDSLPPDIALAYAGVLKAPPPSHPSPASGGGSGWGFAQRWTAWGTGFGGSATTNGDPIVGSNNVTTNTFGYAAGMDYHYSPDTVLGFALAGGGTGWNLAQGLGTGRSNAFLAGLYGVTHQGPLYLAGSLAFAENWFTTNRTALGDQLVANFQGQSYAARLEGGYRFAVPVAYNAIGITPYAAIQAQSFHTPAYSETDLTAGGLGLSYAAMNGTDTRSELGARFDDPTLLGNMPLILRAKLAWAHDWVSNPAALNAAFESLPGTGFTVNGAPIPQNSALTSAGAELFFTPNWSLLAKFDGEFASGAQTYAGSGTLRYTW